MKIAKFLVIVVIVIAFAAGYFVRKTSETKWSPRTTPSLTSGSGMQPEDSRVNAIVLAAQKVAPAVVSISVIQTRYYRSSSFWGDEFFDRFFGDVFRPRLYERKVQSLGSGFIIDSVGYILTNEHVIRNGEKIKVTLPDGREFEARITGRNEVLDLALLRIDGSDLPAAPFGDSDNLITGEWAIAIGNPFGYLLEDPQPSVTAGVVSALHRNIKPRGGWASTYKGMIQTDAAINPGNSGGPLVNADGEVIGVNTFIFTAGGGSEGIGFAIPINTAKKIVKELVEHGEVREAWLGIDVQELTPRLSDAIGERKGVLVADVAQGSTAERAGLEIGDLIVQLNHGHVRDVDDWQAAVSSLLIAEDVRMRVLRKHRPLDLTLVAEEPPGLPKKKGKRLGLVVQNITPYLRNKFRLVTNEGIAVIEVERGSSGEAAGVEIGDVILTIENEKVGDAGDFEQIADKVNKGKLSLAVDRRGTKLYLSYTSIW